MTRLDYAAVRFQKTECGDVTMFVWQNRKDKPDGSAVLGNVYGRIIASNTDIKHRPYTTISDAILDFHLFVEIETHKCSH